MKRLVTVLAVAVTLVVATASAASAADIDIPIDTVVRAPEGSLTLLETVDTPADLIGWTCTGFARAQNQDSVHPDNDLIVNTGDTNVVLTDVEGSAAKVTTAEGTVTVGPTISVTLHMGPDEVFSAGIVVELELNCTEPPQPAVEIVKTANSEFYSAEGVATFTIKVTNPGPVDLIDVKVLDEDAITMDPESDCERAIGDLAVGESVEYECTVSGLDGVSPFDNEAIVIGTDKNGTSVTDNSSATVFPQVLGTTVAPTTVPPTTQAPASTEATLPVTGVETEGLAIGGIIAVLLGLGLLWGTGRRLRSERRNI